MSNSGAPQPAARAAGCLTELSWLSMGFIRPVHSLPFYQRAKSRPVAVAAVFFVVFGLMLASAASIALLRVLAGATQEIEAAYQGGAFPEISITGGRAEVDGPQPFVLADDPTGLIVLDTSGTYSTIDRTVYPRGLLLTATEIHVFDNNQYRILGLTDLQELLGDPFLLNENTALGYWRTFTAFFTLFSLVALGFWNTLVWFAWLSFLALFFWGFANLIERGAGFGEVLILGVYAYVPATYLQLVLGLGQITIFGLRTLLLLGIWGFLAIRLLGSEDQDARAAI